MTNNKMPLIPIFYQAMTVYIIFLTMNYDNVCAYLNMSFYNIMTWLLVKQDVPRTVIQHFHM